MFSIAQYLDCVKQKAGIASDYRLSKLTGIGLTSVCNYRNGRSLPDEVAIENLCNLSGDDPGVVAAQIQAERSKNPKAKQLWENIAMRLAGGANSAILSWLFAIGVAIGLIALPVDSAQAATAFGNHHEMTQQSIHRIYYVFTTVLLLVAFLLAFDSGFSPTFVPAGNLPMFK